MERPQTALPLLSRTHSRRQSQNPKHNPMPKRRDLSPFTPSSNKGKTSAFRRSRLRMSEDMQNSSQSKVYDTADSTQRSMQKQQLEENNVEELTSFFYDIMLKTFTEGFEFEAFPNPLPTPSPSLTEISDHLAANTQRLIAQMNQFAALPNPEFHP